MGGYEMAMLTGRIDHHHNSIINHVNLGSFANEVDTDSVPVILWDWQWIANLPISL